MSLILMKIQAANPVCWLKTFIITGRGSKAHLSIVQWTSFQPLQQLWNNYIHELCAICLLEVYFNWWNKLVKEPTLVMKSWFDSLQGVSLDS